MFDTVWRNARLATLALGAAGLGVVEHGAVASRAGRIAYAGPESALPSPGATKTIDCGGRWITPGLIDCHTHLVYAGNRAAEFEQRLAGRAGATREAARALGLLDQIGTLEAGKQCDLAIWSVDALAELVYRIGFNPLHRRVWRGR